METHRVSDTGDIQMYEVSPLGNVGGHWDLTTLQTEKLSLGNIDDVV